MKTEITISAQSAKTFSDNIIQWYQREGRKNLPWQTNKTPYRVWVSEIMLQQTQVATVLGYYQKFMARFPTIKALAQATDDDVLHYWTGLGYYARARNLHQAAKIIMAEYQGEFPQTLAQVMALPGIGRSTAGAILTFACGQAWPILDGNVKRVLARQYCVPGHNGQAAFNNTLWHITSALTPKVATDSYNQAMMDIGATICTRSKPQCHQCPVASSCLAYHRDEQAVYPQKKPKKTIPIKQTIMIMPKIDGKVLMEKRPPAGIWGGLWCFYEVSAIADIPELLNQLGLKERDRTALPQFRHSFSHFHLDITPMVIECQLIPEQQVGESQQQKWYDLATPNQVGLAASTQQLLSYLSTNVIKETT